MEPQVYKTPELYYLEAENLNKTGEVVITFNCPSPFYIYKFQIDCD